MSTSKAKVEFIQGEGTPSEDRRVLVKGPAPEREAYTVLPADVKQFKAWKFAQEQFESSDVKKPDSLRLASAGPVFN